MSLGDTVNVVSGIGDKKAKLLAKLGISSVRDLLYYMPRTYELPGQSAALSALQADQTYQISATIGQEPQLRRIRNGAYLATFTLIDETGSVEAVFFNQRYICKMYKKGDHVFLSGKTKKVGRKLQFTNPHIEKEGGQHEGLSPVYALTGGLTQKVMRIMMKAAIKKYHSAIRDIFPEDFRKAHKLCDASTAIRDIHLPQNEEVLAAAKRRLLFEELLLFNIALHARETDMDMQGYSFHSGENMTDDFLRRLSYTPTGAQLRVMKEIASDLGQTKPMSRLLQGDVGSGKTTPAFYAMHICARNNKQCVMMAPTEVLVKQHFINAQKVLGSANINIELITGSTSVAQKKIIYENIAGGLTDIVIGTHAVLYDKLQFANLGLIITDEQHRFGVAQRAMLESKSIAPHTLIMSATPIPRTLALILYGKTDISIIDEMPPGRQPVKTFCVPEKKRSDMYRFIEEQLQKGDQVFVVCPLVAQNEAMDMMSSEQLYKALNVRFSAQGVALLHGKMKPSEKNEIMQQFKDNKFGVLVSTTVIEVGVDIPDATIMVIENAERFGLSQLHQLRGRVGRSDKPSYCFLMCDQKDNERLNILTKTNDGFVISEEDLRLRGPGQFLGAKQSGMSDLYMANLIKDMKLLKQTRVIAEQISQSNYDFYHQLLKSANSIFGHKMNHTTIN